MGEKEGIVDENGWIIEPKYDKVDFDGSIAMVTLDDKTGVLNKEGKWVIELNEDVTIFSPKEGACKVGQNDKWGFVNENGWLVKPQFEYVFDFSEGLAAVEKDGKWGFVDKSGKLVIDVRFDWADSFEPNGKAKVRIEDGANTINGYVDRNGNFTQEE